MKEYEKPVIKIVQFSTEDILTASGIPDEADIDGNSTGFLDEWLK